MKIVSPRVGELTYEGEDIVTFTAGLPGFGAQHQFIIIPYHEDSPFAFLQSVGDPTLSFLIVDPFSFFANYEFELPETVGVELELATALPRVFNIVTMADTLAGMTVNLMAPIVINESKRQGAQIILEKSAYTTKHQLFPEADQRAEGRG